MDHTKSKIGPKACTTCAKAKARCNPGRTDEICERCHRLNKPCSPQTPAPPRKRKPQKATRVAELEKRLESLTARVESRQQRPATLTEREPLVEVEGPPPKIRKLGGPQYGPVDEGRPNCLHIFADYQEECRERAAKGQDGGYQLDSVSVENGEWSPGEATQHQRPQPGRTPSSTLSPATENEAGTSQSQANSHGSQVPQLYQDPLPSGGISLAASGEPWYYPSPAEAQQSLEEYGDHLVPLFPFVVLPPNTTAVMLRERSPLLWKAIMMQGLHMHAMRQSLMGEEVVKDVATAAFIHPRKSLDLLQAIEVIIAWFHSSTKSFELTNLLFLMRSICVSLGFNESQEFSEQQSTSLASLEQMRAFTGVYYLVTMVFTTNKKPDAFMNTTYLDYCCRVLEERMEYPSDKLVVLLVRTQQLSQSISMTLAFRKNRDSSPLSLTVQSFQHQIRQLRSTVPQGLSDNVNLITQMHIAETLLYEVGVSDELSAGLAPPERLELLWNCLTSARAALESRFKKSYNGWPRATSLSSFDFTYAMLVCLTLSLLQLPGWDLRIVRKEFDLDKYMVLQIEDLKQFASRRSLSQESVQRVGGAPNGASQPAPFQDPYLRLHARLSQLRICILAELAATLPPGPPQSKETAVSVEDNAIVGNGEGERPGPDAGGILGEAYTDDIPGFDDVFWQDIYKPNEWDMNFSTLLGWDAGDQAVPTYTSWSGEGTS